MNKEKVRVFVDMLKVHNLLNEVYDTEPQLYHELGFDEPFKELEEKIAKVREEGLR